MRVLYRYDALRRKRYTTAEITVDESDWDPLPSKVARREKVAVRVGLNETRLREKVKAAAGGRWDPGRKVSMLPMEQVLQLACPNASMPRGFSHGPTKLCTVGMFRHEVYTTLDKLNEKDFPHSFSHAFGVGDCNSLPSLLATHSYLEALSKIA